MFRFDRIDGKRLGFWMCLTLALAVCGGCQRSPLAKKAKFMESGKAFMQSKDYPAAILQFRNAAQYAGGDPQPYYELALAYLADGELPKGVASLRQALKLNPKHAAARLRLAELETSIGSRADVQAAEKTLQGMLSEKPDNADALSTLGMAEIRLGKEADGVKDLEAALQKSPENLKASVLMAQLKLKHGDSEGAEQVLQSAVQKAPKAAAPLVALASFYVAAKRFPDAQRTLQQALQLDSQNVSALLSLAAVQMRLGQKDQAEPLYAKLSTIPPGRYKAIHAQFLYEEGKRDAAIAEFAKLAKDDPEDGQARTRLVAACWFANRKAEAEKVLTDALKQNPKDTDALMQRAEMEVVSNRYAAAQVDADQVLFDHPESAPAHFLRANVYRARGDSALERQELGEALRYKKDMLAARLQLAQSFLRQNDGKAALAVLESKEAPERQRNSLQVFVLRNYAYLEMKDFASAEKNVTAALAKIKTPDLLMQDAMIKANKKDYAGARASLEAVLKANPEDLRALGLLGKTYLAQNLTAQGTAKIREYAASRAQSARLQEFLGDWLAGTGDRTGALQAYAAAKQMDPQLVSADLAMARLYIAANKDDAARQILTRLVQAGNASAAAYVWLGGLDDRAGNFTSAIANYRKALSMDANNPMALNNLAFLLAEHGQAQELDEAMKLAQQVRSLVPNSGSIHDTIGWVYYKKGTYPSAIQQLEEAVSQDEAANTPAAVHYYHLAMAYLKNGNRKRGNEQLNRALKLNPNLPEAKQALTLLAQTKAGAN